MPDSLSKFTHSSSPLTMIKEQGIVAILRSDSEIPKDAASLRRTLSADMSSKKWLTQHGFSSMKKIASSEGFYASIADSSSSSSSSEGEEEYCDDRKEERRQGEFDFWCSIQDQKNKKKIETEKQGEFDSWSSILSQKSADVAKSLPVPYIHPLMKKSLSSLSEKSLEICTESLGSENGSDGFSSYPPSEVGDMDEESKEDQQSETFSQTHDRQEWRPIKYSHKKSPPRSFPPLITSLSGRDGDSLRMQARRENGRLILEAVSVPSQNNFRAERQDGRLVLSFITTPSDQNKQSSEKERNKEEESLEEVKEAKTGEERDNRKIENDSEFEEMEQAPKISSSVINFHRLALMMKKPNGRKEFKDTVKLEQYHPSEAPISLAQSLPPRPKKMARIPPSPPPLTTPTAAASLNAYEYYWRSKPTMKSQNPISQQPMKNSSRKLIFPSNSMGNENQQVLVLRGNRGDYLVPLSNGCKIPRRSLLLWEPCCIATT